ncbi:MAG: histidine phosphotransferase ChpT [Methyloligella sp. ZOD6]
MSEQAIADIDLTALISSRICHDVISPVGAISNGLEVLSDETDAEMREHAMELIVKSAAQASAKLQFARLAFGAAGSAGAEIDLRDAEKVSRDFVKGKHELTWTGPLATLPKNKVKLLLNLISLGVVALPRGGTLDVHIDDQASRFEIRGKGQAAGLKDEMKALLSADGATDGLDAHSIQPYFARRLAESIGMSISVENRPEEVVLVAS